jgi:hypothetical protein
LVFASALAQVSHGWFGVARYIQIAQNFSFLEGFLQQLDIFH